MQRFFRVLRQGLLKENRLRKYLAYAVGEVALVIVGILIAIYLNNSNEQRKKRSEIQLILEQIQSELATDVMQAGELIESYRRKDSLIFLVMNDRVTAEDYYKEENYELKRLTSNYGTFNLQNNGFSTLMQKIDDVPPKYNPLIKRLKEIYIDNHTEINRANQQLVDCVMGILLEQRNSQPWYANWSYHGETTEELVDYFLQNLQYKNGVADYANYALENLAPMVMILRADAIDLYFTIGKALGESMEELMMEAPFYIDHSGLKSWEGTYINAEARDTMKIAVSDKSIELDWAGDNYEIYPLSDRTFHLFSPYFFSFETDRQTGQVNLVAHIANEKMVYKK
ncbi:MAG: hypothetical protein HEP71_23245 [Roseivirga sp.]|nr:hypothetical protein [Roseivirga sp.]